MKQIITLFSFFLLTIGASAQGIEIEIPGLAGNNSAFEATSVQMVTTPATNTGRRGGSSGGTKYLVIRSTDQMSAAIQEASNKGRFFKRAGIYLTLADGSTSIRSLDKVYISGYTANFGGDNAGEQFYINYHTETVVIK